MRGGSEGQGEKPAAGIPQEARHHDIIGVDAGYPLFSSAESRGNFSGFEIEAARLVAEREVFDVTFAAVPWDTIVPALESGKIDII